MIREPYPSDVAPRFIVRLPGDLRARVKARAQRNRRSMNAEIVLMIERGLVASEARLPAQSSAPHNSLSDNLIVLRGAKGLSQRELAERAGMAAAQLSRYETGRSRPRAEALASLARALETPLKVLLGERGALEIATLDLPSCLEQTMKKEPPCQP